MTQTPKCFNRPDQALLALSGGPCRNFPKCRLSTATHPTVVLLHDIAEVVDWCNCVSANTTLNTRTVADDWDFESTLASFRCNSCAVKLTCRGSLTRCQGIVGGGLHGLGAHVLALAEDDARPFSQEALGLTLDGRLGLRGFGVEDDDFADTGGHESFFGHVEAAEDGEELALDLVVG
jgi:hypothetical protein